MKKTVRSVVSRRAELSSRRTDDICRVGWPHLFNALPAGRLTVETTMPALCALDPSLVCRWCRLVNGRCAQTPIGMQAMLRSRRKVFYRG